MFCFWPPLGSRDDRMQGIQQPLTSGMCAIEATTQKHKVRYRGNNAESAKYEQLGKWPCQQRHKGTGLVVARESTRRPEDRVYVFYGFSYKRHPVR